MKNKKNLGIRLITRQQFAKKICVSRSTLYRYEREYDDFPSKFHIARKAKFSLEEVDNWIRSKRL